MNPINNVGGGSPIQKIVNTPVQKEVPASETGRPSKVYSITRAGKRQLRLEAENWTRLSMAVNGILESV